MTMNADEALINAVYCQVQCLGCTDWRSDRVKAAIGKFYLAKPGVRESCRPAARSVVAQVLQERRRSDLHHVPDRAGALQGGAINVVTA
jgi:hypothetical protein